MSSLDQLKAFAACAEMGSFSAAARKLGKAQSAISHTIANLEIDLGFELFDRSTRKPTLTAQGRQLLTHAKAVLTQAQEFQSAALALAGDDESEITLVIDPALLLPSLYRMLQEFSHRFPVTSLTLNIANSDEIPAIIKNKQAHFGLMLMNGSLPVGIEVGFIGPLPFYAVAASEHPLSQLAEIHHRDLLPHRQLQLSSSAGIKGLVCPDISSIKYWSNDFEAMKQMAEANLGWCYLPVHMAEPSIEAGKLKRLLVTYDLKIWTMPVDRIMPVNVARGPVLTWLEKESVNLLES